MNNITICSCDLLKISYLCTGINNQDADLIQTRSVVICLKFRIFAQVSTTSSRTSYLICCCDLLKISYLCTGINNYCNFDKEIQTVVICLKFRIFAQVSTTTALTALVRD